MAGLAHTSQKPVLGGGDLPGAREVGLRPETFLAFAMAEKAFSVVFDRGSGNLVELASSNAASIDGGPSV